MEAGNIFHQLFEFMDNFPINLRTPKGYFTGNHVVTQRRCTSRSDENIWCQR